MRDYQRLLVRLEDGEREAFDRGRRLTFQSVQGLARRYIVEGLRRDGLLADSEPSTERSAA